MHPLVAIVGGGISGLSAAYELTRRGVPFVLFERSARCGGVVLTERAQGYTIDAGPDALLTQKPAAIELCRALALGDRLRSQAARETFVVRRGRLCQLPAASVLGIPTRLGPFATTGAFSWIGKLRMAAEVFVPPHHRHDDESIASFMGRHFGREAVEYLAEPLLAGIHGGDPAMLSMRASFPRFLDLEAQYRSVILGLRKAAAVAGATAHTPRAAAGPFVALPNGMEELTLAITRALPRHAIRTGVGVAAMESRGHGYLLHLTSGASIRVPTVILATPPPATGHLVEPFDADAARLCRGIRMASAVTVALGFQRSAVRHPLKGAGFVVPRRERLTIRAVSWVSSKWTGRAPNGHVLLRAYLGGIADPGAVDLDDGTLAATAHADMTDLLDIVGEPDLVRVYRWRNATPQLEVGHSDRVARLDARLAAHPGLFVTASGFRGTGIADCVADGRRQASLAADGVAQALTA
jgi:oxygen-dependent protoporphyrinogen oxidase